MSRAVTQAELAMVREHLRALWREAGELATAGQLEAARFYAGLALRLELVIGPEAPRGAS